MLIRQLAQYLCGNKPQPEARSAKRMQAAKIARRIAQGKKSKLPKVGTKSGKSGVTHSSVGTINRLLSVLTVASSAAIANASSNRFGFETDGGLAS